MLGGNFSDTNGTLPIIPVSTLRALGFLSCALVVIGIPGNVLVILSVCLDRQLRTAANWLVVSLSVCDFLFLFLVLPFHAFSQIVGRPLIPELCFIMGFLTNCLVGSSILSTGAIAFNRYIAVVLHNKYKYFSGTKAVVVTCACVYILPFILASPTFSGKLGTFRFDPVDRLCNWWKADVLQTVLVACVASLPLILMTFCYISILLHVVGSKKRVGAAAPSINSNAQQTRMESRLSRMLAMVYIVYMITAFPSFLLGTLASLGVPFSASTLAIAFGVVWCSSAINPIVYGLVNKNYRVAYKKVAKKLTSPLQLCKVCN